MLLTLNYSKSSSWICKFKFFNHKQLFELSWQSRKYNILWKPLITNLKWETVQTSGWKETNTGHFTILVFSRKWFGLCQSSSCSKRDCISRIEVFCVFVFSIFSIEDHPQCNRNKIKHTYVNCTEFVFYVSRVDTEWSHAYFHTHLMFASCILNDRIIVWKS